VRSGFGFWSAFVNLECMHSSANGIKTRLFRQNWNRMPDTSVKSRSASFEYGLWPSKNRCELPVERLRLNASVLVVIPIVL
jgi:hypothetical protein